MSLTVAMGLLQFAPKLIGLFNDDAGSKVTAIADTVSDVAKAITGKPDVPSAVEALKQSPELALQFEMAVMENETVLERLDEQSRERASEQYQKTGHKQADKIADSVIKFNLPIILVLVLGNVIAVNYLGDQGSLIAVVSNLIGIVIGRLLEERQSVIAFFFGSSLGSKQKAIKAANKQ